MCRFGRDMRFSKWIYQNGGMIFVPACSSWNGWSLSYYFCYPKATSQRLPGRCCISFRKSRVNQHDHGISPLIVETDIAHFMVLCGCQPVTNSTGGSVGIYTTPWKKGILRKLEPTVQSGQISIIPKPELRGFWGSSLIKPPFRVTSADVVIICPVQ